MWVTEADVNMLRAWATQRLAEKLGIQDPEWMTSVELVELIEQVDPNGAQLLGRFNDAYREWFDFHVEIERDGKSGKLNATEQHRLHALIKARDESRVALRDYILK